MRVANLHQTNRCGKKLRLIFPKDLPDASFPNVPPHCCGLRFSAHHDPDHRLFFRRRFSAFAAPHKPQIKKLPPSELPPLDEMFKGRLPAYPLFHAEPLNGLQRLYLGQLFPALFATARENFSSSGSPRTGKKAVFVATFSFGRLVCSFHEAWIIVKFVCNIQRFILLFCLIRTISFCSASFFAPPKKTLFLRGQNFFLL